MQVSDEMIEAAMAVPVVSGRENYVRRCLTAALSALVEEKPVAVKALEWEDGYAFCPVSGGHWHSGYVEGRRAFGLYSHGMPNAGAQGFFSTLDEAKAAAQADYEQRIRSALVGVPAVESEPVAWYREGFVHNFYLGPSRPNNSTQDPNEWRPLYASPVRSALAPAPAGEDVAGLLDRLEEETNQKFVEGLATITRAEIEMLRIALSRKPSDAQTVGDGMATGTPAPEAQMVGEFHLKLVDDHMPEDVPELIAYLREMACVHPESGERQMPTAVDDAAFDMAAAALEKMQDALRKIENPMDHFRQLAEDEGAGLDGAMAVLLAGDAEYLKGIARAALAHQTPSPAPIQTTHRDPLPSDADAQTVGDGSTSDASGGPDHG